MIYNKLKEKYHFEKEWRLAIYNCIAQHIFFPVKIIEESLQDRNNTSHTYDEEAAETIVTAIRKNYFPLLKGLLNTLDEKKKDVRIKRQRHTSHKKNSGKL